jgi:hypothetical protein
MSKPITHIIHKLNLEIDVPDEKLARKMYQQAGSLLQQYVLPKLEELLKRIDDGGLHININSLNIDIDASRTSSLEEVIKTQIAAAVMDEIAAVLKKNESDGKQEQPLKRTGHQQIVDAFIWFIEHGELPWWFADGSLLADSTNIIEAISNREAKFVPTFLQLLKCNVDAVNRLLLQYDAVLLTYLFSLLVPLEIFTEAAESERRLVNSRENNFNAEGIKLHYWQHVWRMHGVEALAQLSIDDFQKPLQLWIGALLSSDADNIRLNPFVVGDKLVDYKETSKEETTELDAHSDKRDERDGEIKVPVDGLLAAHAGLVLLHPFLQYFFAELKLLNGESFPDKKCRAIAVHVLHYLATGQECAPDFNLLFEKYLCGMSAEDTTNRYTKLTQEMKTEADGLLGSVVKHWSALKSTSAEALRESFLQRKGKLVVAESGHRIVMEQSSLDILLMRIPWNISLIKLPWLQQLIHVEWGV